MQLPPQIIPIQHAGHAALRLATRHGSAIVALQGAHLLSWVPAGQRDVFWLSPQSPPAPAAIRGGVPVCWPWFAKQDRPESAAQHGPVRNLRWQVNAVHASSDDEVSLTLAPCPDAAQAGDLATLAPGLAVSLRITLGRTLAQRLTTRNLGDTPFALTQALHSYFAVSNAAHVRIDGLEGLAYQDKLRSMAPGVQHTPFALAQACDRIYHRPAAQSAQVPGHRYTLVDAAWQRQVVVETHGSQSVVVWNPGREGARRMADVPDQGWRDYFCIEAANAGPDVVALAPGAEHALAQELSII